MIVPPLAIIVLNAGVNPWLGIPIAAAVLFAGWVATRRPDVKNSGFTGLVWFIAVTVALSAVFVPYGIAFKLVSVAGFVSMPTRRMGDGTAGPSLRADSGPGRRRRHRLLLRYELQHLRRQHRQHAGRRVRVLDQPRSVDADHRLAVPEPRHRTMASVISGASGDGRPDTRDSSHLRDVRRRRAHRARSRCAPLVGPRRRRGRRAVPTRVSATSFSTGRRLAAVAVLPIVLVALASLSAAIIDRAKFMLVVGPSGALISAIWLFPFYARSSYFNDMGWERLDDYWPSLVNTPMRLALPVAAVGALLAFAFRDRLGMLFTIAAIAAAVGVAHLPAGKLWNARLLPFYYLSVYLVAAIGVALLARVIGAAVSERLDAPEPWTVLGVTGVAMAASLIGIAFTLQNLPFGGTNESGRYSFAGVEGGERSFIPSWVTWNYSGYEAKRSYAEYAGVVQTMEAVGASNGCGRAMWEYSSELDRYGTPMALMLLPHWTDGCIGSMEGLYFESSATTPFHFLNQSTLSTAPSRAQRDLPYQDFDIDKGVAQLQTTGVRYYMAQSDEAIAAADQHQALSRIAESPPFVVYEVDGTPLVEALDYEPVVASGPREESITDLSTRFEIGWESQAVAYYNDPGAFQALPAEDGPNRWDRVTNLIASDGAPTQPVVVSDVAVGRSSISFCRRQTGNSGAGQGFLLPQLVGVGCRRPLPGWTESHGRRTDRHPGPTDLRLHLGRVPLVPHVRPGVRGHGSAGVGRRPHPSHSSHRVGRNRRDPSPSTTTSTKHSSRICSPNCWRRTNPAALGSQPLWPIWNIRRLASPTGC